jgi:NDP-hexose 3,5-(Or5-) epimerase
VVVDPAGPAKYVTCVAGAVRHVAVDLRPGSPAFGTWAVNHLVAEEPTCLFLPPGVGHAYLGLTGDATMLYLLSQEHVPQSERILNPLAVDLGLPWPKGRRFVLSPRSCAAPGLREAVAAGWLPAWRPSPVAA